MKKLLSILSFVMLLLLVSCGISTKKNVVSETVVPADNMNNGVYCTEPSTENFQFVDSLGREVLLPPELTRVAVTGPLAQIYVYAIAPEKLAGISRDWDKGAENYISEEFLNLPVLGQIYGGKGEMNKEEILKVDPQVIIDIGEAKKNIKQDLDSLQEQLGIPIVHIDASLSTSPAAFRKLGELFYDIESGNELAEYLEAKLKETNSLMEAVGKERKKLIYVLGENGNNILAKGSFHSEVVDMLGDNLAVVDEPSSKGSGNEVDMEYILGLDPDVIVFAPGSIYESVLQMNEWQQLRAIQNKEYFEAPNAIYNWMGFPPSVQRYLGMIWLSDILYPEQSQIDLKQETLKFYDLFYHVSLTDEQYNSIIKNSVR